MGNELTAEDAALRRKGKRLIELDVSESQQFMMYHDPETGQELPRLPADQFHMLLYVTEKGWRPGPAPEHLREKWEAGREERDRKAQARLEAVKKTPEFREVQEQVESVPRSEVKDIVQEAVQAAVQEVRKELGIIPDKPESILPSTEEELPLYGTQLPMFDSPA